MWKWIIRAAVAIAQSDWAKAKAHELVVKIRSKAEAKAAAIAATAGIEPPKLVPSIYKVSRIVRAQTEAFKIGDNVNIEGETYRIARLIKASQGDVVYEAVPV